MGTKREPGDKKCKDGGKPSWRVRKKYGERSLIRKSR